MPLLLVLSLCRSDFAQPAEGGFKILTMFIVAFINAAAGCFMAVSLRLRSARRGRFQNINNAHCYVHQCCCGLLYSGVASTSLNPPKAVSEY
jgi:hypothetical protein